MWYRSEKVKEIVRIQRATYFLGGQAIALQVTGGSPQDGLYYILSDQLGSANTLVKNGAVVSQQRFLPFGERRGWDDEAVAPWQNRGFTGHLHNDEVGLIYMNARYYVPSLGRFASADTIVPDPSNPQQFNRFSYVLNNPIRFNDPSGHCPQEGTGHSCNLSDGVGYITPPRPKPAIPEGSMILFTGAEWSDADKAQILDGAQITGDALATILNKAYPHWNLSGEEAFMFVYGGSVTFNRTGGSCKDDDRNTIGVCGARTEGRNLITVYTDADAITHKSHWARHELGHAFVYAVGKSGTVTRLTQAITNNPYLGREADPALDYGFASTQISPRSWQQSTLEAGTAHSEIWADMYLGWTSNAWATNRDGSFTARGQARSNFMNSAMVPLLVNLNR